MFRLSRLIYLPAARNHSFLLQIHQGKAAKFAPSRKMSSQIGPKSPVQADRMLKHRVLALELLKKRVEEKASRNKNLVMNSAEIVVLGNNSILVISEGKSYLFNAVEGTQRLCYLNSIKLTSLENIFLTNSRWSPVSGALGMSLTMQDIGAPELCIHSIENIGDFFEASEQFMTFNTGMKCGTRCVKDGDFVDTGIRIRSILRTTDNQSYSPTNKSEQIYGDNRQAPKRVKSNTTLLAYSCTLPDLPGVLDPSKCRELKVPIGPQLAQLKSGQDVVLADGRLVKSVDVCGPKSLGLHFLIVDCLSENSIYHLTSSNELNIIRNLRRIDDLNRPVDVIVHFSPKSVTSNQKYRDWMEGFPRNCKHLFLHDQERRKIKYLECYRSQYMLHQLDPLIFPKLYLPSELEEKVNSELVEHSNDSEFDSKTSVNNFDDLQSITEVSSMDRLGIRPRKYLETSDSIVGIHSLHQAAKLDPHFDQVFEKLKSEQKNMPQAKDHEPEVIFLGTGSALPSKLRNTSCILFNLKYPKQASIIMDCGEDSYGQLYRHYGPERTNEILRQLKLIYVSHHHADHHIGLIRLLRHRMKVSCDPLILMLPPGIEKLLDYQNQNFEDLSGSYKVFSTKHMKISPSSPFVTGSCLSTQVKEELCKSLEGLLEDVSVVGVSHCVHSCAVVMRFKIGHPEMATFTLAYSGDARPSEDFVIVGKNCDLLIHEATMDHRSTEDAISKKHSTSHEAIDVGRHMEAKFTILTHFSQRLPKIPFFTEQFDDKVGFAFDNLSLRCPSHFARLPIMKQILSLVFKKSLNEIEMKHLKDELKQKTIKDILQSQQVG